MESTNGHIFSGTDVELLAKGARGVDKDVYRAEFIILLKSSVVLAKR